jgi:hypothetical protein
VRCGVVCGVPYGTCTLRWYAVLSYGVTAHQLTKRNETRVRDKCQIDFRSTLDVPAERETRRVPSVRMAMRLYTIDTLLFDLHKK